MKKLNKKGFTIVELVIVIAVIGILSAVLIPTFSNLTDKANQSAAEQAVVNEYKEWLVENAEKDNGLPTNLLVEYNNYWFQFNGNQFESITAPTIADQATAPANYVLLTDRTGIYESFFAAPTNNQPGFTLYVPAANN